MKVVEKPTQEQKSGLSAVGQILHKMAPSIARNRNLHRPEAPQLLPDSVKVGLALTDDWTVILTVRYAGEAIRKVFYYLDVQTKLEEDRLLMFVAALENIIADL